MKKRYNALRASYARLSQLIRYLLLLAAISLCIFGGCYLYLMLWGPQSFDSQEVNSDSLYSEQQGGATEELETEPELCEVVVKDTIRKGSTAGGLLQEWLSPDQLHSFVEASRKVYPLHKIRAGQPFSVTHTGGVLARFEYEIDDNQKLVIHKEDNSFAARLESIDYDVLLDRVEGTIDSSLFDSMARLGETPILAVTIADIFAWEINFIRDIQAGDSFRILVEKRFRDGEAKGYGRILAAEFTNQGKKYEAFSYKDAQGRVNYYNSKGESVRRAFLKAPLSFTRISSRFSPRRFHPILQTWKSHPAIDYAAPTGTPVKAIGSGTVIFSGWGKGAGNYITLRHHGGYESMYLHLSGFAKGLKKGKKVQQGEVIGFVGSTGYSTGPHLDFRMKKNGTFINPEKNLSPRAEPITGKQLQEFRQRCERIRLYFDGEKSLADYGSEKEQL